MASHAAKSASTSAPPSHPGHMSAEKHAEVKSAFFERSRRRGGGISGRIRLEDGGGCFEEINTPSFFCVCVWGGGSCCYSQVLGLMQRCLFSHSLPAFWEMGAQNEELFLCAAVASSLPLSKAVNHQLLQSRSPSALLDRRQRTNANRRLLSAGTVNETRSSVPSC